MHIGCLHNHFQEGSWERNLVSCIPVVGTVMLIFNLFKHAQDEKKHKDNLKALHFRNEAHFKNCDFDEGNREFTIPEIPEINLSENITSDEQVTTFEQQIALNQDLLDEVSRTATEQESYLTDLKISTALLKEEADAIEKAYGRTDQDRLRLYNKSKHIWICFLVSNIATAIFALSAGLILTAFCSISMTIFTTSVVLVIESDRQWHIKNVVQPSAA